jgi:hypothetical protein
MLWAEALRFSMKISVSRALMVKKNHSNTHTVLEGRRVKRKVQVDVGADALPVKRQKSVPKILLWSDPLLIL